MTEDERLEQYFAICQRIYEQMERDGTWPWKDEEDLVECTDNQ